MKATSLGIGYKDKYFFVQVLVNGKPKSKDDLASDKNLHPDLYVV